jgi:aquaporin Z
MLNTYLTEALGTLIFLSVILFTGNRYLIAVALLIGIVVAQMSSQAHLNPAVTFMMLLDGKVNNTEALYYVIAQLVGAAAAYYVVKHSKTQPFIA